ncbi:hypothetical protein Ae356Ps1_3537c [Pseudonocardia sp. Ae356_Ps1]|nr:hypothetical protein Ae356Ps1_3537c [Pseudonocardia sp. Ae356_Ps1]
MTAWSGDDSGLRRPHEGGHHGAIARRRSRPGPERAPGHA